VHRNHERFGARLARDLGNEPVHGAQDREIEPGKPCGPLFVTQDLVQRNFCSIRAWRNALQFVLEPVHVHHQPGVRHPEDVSTGGFREQGRDFAGSEINRNVPFKICRILDPQGAAVRVL